MSLSAATIRAMANKGLTASDIADIAEIEAVATEADPRAAKRAYDRERMRQKRADAEKSHDSRTTVADDISDMSHDIGDLAPIRAQVVNPSLSSFQSERALTPNQTTFGTAPKPEKPKSRAFKRCPETWLPKLSTLDLLASEGHTPGDLERAMTRMRDHEYRTPRSDWDAAFRNWVRTDHDRRPKPANTDAKFDAKQANLARAFAGAERVTGPRPLP